MKTEPLSNRLLGPAEPQPGCSNGVPTWDRPCRQSVLPSSHGRGSGDDTGTTSEDGWIAMIPVGITFLTVSEDKTTIRVHCTDVHLFRRDPLFSVVCATLEVRYVML